MKLLLILCLSTFYCLSVYALGGWTSGGGYAAKRGNTYYLYDFVEGQLYDNIYIDHAQTDQMQINKRLRSVMMPLGEEVVSLTNKKINEIYMMVPEFAELLVKTIETYQWRTTEWQILAANDLGNTYGTPPAGNNIEKIPMVFRDDSKKVAWIVKDIWQKLSINQKLGTIFHEAIYALMAEQLNYHTSEHARELNIYIFDSTFQYQSTQQFMGKLQVLGWNKSWLTYEEYIHFNSDEFAKECKTFNDQVETFISSAVKEYHKLYTKQKAVMWDISNSKGFSGWNRFFFNWCYYFDQRPYCHNDEEVEYSVNEMFIGANKYFYPSENKIYQRIPYIRYEKNLFGSGSNKKIDKILFSDNELTNIKNYIYQANQLLQTSDSQFQGQCQMEDRYQESSLTIMKNFATMQILN